MRRRDFLKAAGACAAFAAAVPRATGGPAAGASAGAAPAAEPPDRLPFLKGGDVSLLQKIEDLGIVYRQDGRPRDALAIFKDAGCNAMRLRLFHTPDGKGPLVNDLPYTLRLARRIRAAGLRLVLDLHYSDTWADPAHQTKPRAWRDLEPDRLEAAVGDYTREVAAAFKGQGTPPDVVQIGNEITPGMLWDTGRVGGKFDTPEQWRRLAGLVRSGIRGLRLGLGPAARAMIHVDRGGDAQVTRWFFDHLAAEGVAFDLIGLSYYPWWHGPVEDLARNLAETAARFAKDIVVVETACPWRGDPPQGKDGGGPASPHPPTPEGQKAFLEEMIRTVRAAPGGRGRGVLWWAPEWIPVEGLGSPWGDRALFDRQGNVLPAMAAFGG